MFLSTSLTGHGANCYQKSGSEYAGMHGYHLLEDLAPFVKTDYFGIARFEVT